MQEIKPINEVLNTKQKKLAFFQNLVILAAADGLLESGESDFLREVGDKLELDPEEVMPIADNLKYLSFIIPADGIQKTLELQTLVQMMLKDGQVHDTEYALCLDYAQRIGFNKDILDDMILQLSQSNSSE